MITLKSYLLGIILIIFSFPVAGQIDKNFIENTKRAFTAETITECQSSLLFCDEVLEDIPNHPLINYLAARLYALLGYNEIALDKLKKATELGYTSSARMFKIHQLNDPAFNNLRNKKEFNEIIEIMRIANIPIRKSEIAFIIKDKTLETEGICYDPVERMFYLGSKNEIIKVDQFGESIVFTKEGEKDGLAWVNGIHVDAIHRTLWACSNNENSVEIFKYQLSSGKLINKYILLSDGSPHMFNDLVIHRNGDIYISNTLDGAIYTIPYSTDKLELFLKSKLFHGLNGITLSDDGRVIFVANDNLGIYKVDIETKVFARLTHNQSFNTYGIDGLYFEDNYLYAVQNALMPQISRFSLNKDASHLESCKYFEKNTLNLSAPTTGVLVDNYFYFISANNLEGTVVMKSLLN